VTSESSGASTPGPVRFSPAIVLTKVEAFEACEVCAEAERALLRSGQVREADRLAELFTFFEACLTAQSDGEPSGSKSRDSELTQ